MPLIIDHRQVSNWAKRLQADPERLDQEMVKTLNGIAGRGVEYAIDFAPRKDGTLAAGIQVTRAARRGSWRAAFGVVGVEYAWMREKGGTIRARNKSWLTFQINGKWVRVKSVRQKGTKYMQRTHRRLWPEATKAQEGAIERALEGR